MCLTQVVNGVAAYLQWQRDQTTRSFISTLLTGLTTFNLLLSNFKCNQKERGIVNILCVTHFHQQFEVSFPITQCGRCCLRIKLSRSKLMPGTMCCVLGQDILLSQCLFQLACEQASSEGGKKFGDRKRDSVSEASGSQSVNPRAKQVGHREACRHCF